jgi:hypothetical protein
MLEDIVGEVEVALAQAASGPWSLDENNESFILGEPWAKPYPGFVPVDYHYRYCGIDDIPLGTLEFMANSRVYVESLLAEVKRLRVLVSETDPTMEFS